MSGDDTGLDTLISLAKKMPHGESTRRDAASFASFESKLFARGRKTRTRAVWVVGSLATCAALALAYPLAKRTDLSFAFDSAPELSYRVQPVALASSAEADTERELAFSDGSRVQLAKRSEVNVARVTSRGARVVLNRGRAEVSIARRKQAAWQLVAGPYTVQVTGTAFRLAWSPDSQELEVAMHHGSVIVTGPMAEQGVALAKGQRLVGSPRTRRLVVEEWRGEAAKQAVASSANAPVALDDVVVVQSELAASKASGKPRTLGAHGWAKQVAQGQFESVLSEARAIGFARVLSLGNVSDLGALADAARYARQDALGQKTLLALRERFPQSELARDSAFLLGRLSRDQRALEWYERYLSEQPKGAYVSQALGRSMMLCFELGDRARAKSLALSYLTRFPSGPYAGSARKLSDGAATADRGVSPRVERADHASP